MASSRTIASGELLSAADWNNLRADVLANHDHGGTDGVKIKFSDLDVSTTAGSTDPTSGTVSYDDIEAHQGSTPGTGSQGVHGLNSDVYAAGSFGNQKVMITGTQAVSFTGGSGYDSAVVTIGDTMADTNYTVMLTALSGGNASKLGHFEVGSKTTTQFTLYVYSSASSGSWTLTAQWLVVGEVA